MCRSIVCSQVPFSFAIKGGKGHVIKSPLRPNIFIVFSFAKIFALTFFLGSGLQPHLFFFFPLCCSYPPLLSLHTRALMHTHARTHTEENLYVSDIQQGKDKGTELITHHLLLLRRTDGSRRYVNGKGQ